MNEFVWTKETPTLAGWYWKRNALREEKEAVVEIRNYAGKLSIDNCTLSRYVEEESYEWAGPLPKPVERDVIYKAEIVDILMDNDFPHADQEHLYEIKIDKISAYLRVDAQDPSLRAIMAKHNKAYEEIESKWDEADQCDTTADELLALKK